MNIFHLVRFDLLCFEYCHHGAILLMHHFDVTKPIFGLILLFQLFYRFLLFLFFGFFLWAIVQMQILILYLIYSFSLLPIEFIVKILNFGNELIQCCSICCLFIGFIYISPDKIFGLNSHDLHKSVDFVECVELTTISLNSFKFVSLYLLVG